MIKQPIQFAFVLLPLLLASGCGSIPFLGGGEEEVSDPLEAAPEEQPISAAPAQADNAATDSEAQEDEEDFEDPLVEGEEKPKDPKAASGLIPLASEDAAAKLAKSGRQDPFATLPVDAKVLASSNVGESSTNVTTVLPNLPRLPAIPAFQFPPIGPLAPQPEPALPDAPLSSEPFSSEPFSPELPPLPEPTVANELAVTGITISKGIAHAIIESADGKSTYVREGDYVANGQVLVKRIEASKGGPALVVFEELGIEVVKSVGQGGLALN